MRLARMLKLYIAVNGTTAKAIAAEIGVHESTISRFVAGKALPDAEGLVRILGWSCAKEPAAAQTVIPAAEQTS